MRYLYFILFQLIIAIPLQALSQAVTFSPQKGFYTSPFQLNLNSSSGGTIIYTTNGTAPTATTGAVYSGPITINNTTVIRAIAVSGQAVSPVMTNTYFFLNSRIKQPQIYLSGLIQVMN